MSTRRKSLDYWELDNICTHCLQFVGCPLQDVVVQSEKIYLSFYAERLVVLAFDLSPSSPFFSVLEKLPPKKGRQPKPISLFIKSNIAGSEMRDIRVEAEWGRVIFIDFELAQIEIRLIPRAVNMIAIAGSKKISWKKVRELTTATAPPRPEQLRSVGEISAQWQMVERSPQSEKSPGKKGKNKVQRAIENLKKDIEKKEQNLSRKAAEWIHSHQSLDVPEQYSSLVDRELSLIENTQRLFDLAKKNEQKREASKQRLKELEGSLSADTHSGAPHSQNVGSVLRAANVKGRTFISNKGFKVVFGKNAADNLKLLRHAKAWDYWLHLRDFPSSHAIISRNKKQIVDQKSLQEIVLWLLSESFGKGHLKGERIEFVIVECRYVRPVKGAAVGRVQYSNGQTFSVTVP